MRRLTRLLKKADLFNRESPRQFYETIRTLHLSPGETISDQIPPLSWLFVEEGFLIRQRQESNRWICHNVYHEGMSLIFSNTRSTESENGEFQLKEIESSIVYGSFQLKAIEPSIVYYLTKSDEAEMQSSSPGLSGNLTILNIRSFYMHERRSDILKYKESQRIRFVTRSFTILFRIPINDLMEYLDLSSQKDKRALITARKKYYLTYNIQPVDEEKNALKTRI